MSVIATVALALTFQAAPSPDPVRLDIGRRGTVAVQPGQIVDLRSGRVCNVEDIAKAAEGKRFVYIGEEHATAAHQAMEAAVIGALDAAKRQVIVGLEMVTRPKQDILDQWSAGKLTEDEFLEQSDWKSEWGFPYSFYRPVFEAARERHLPVVGLNIPRPWVRQVVRGGFTSLPTSARLQLPQELFMGNGDHRRIFDALVGPHNMPGVSPDQLYSGQVMWDEAMADTALKYLQISSPTPQTVLVVIAGSGHVMYGQGINYRIGRRRVGKGITLVMIESSTPVEVSRGLGDFVYVSAKADAK